MFRQIISDISDTGLDKYTFVLFSTNEQVLNEVELFLMILQPSKLKLVSRFSCSPETYEEDAKIYSHISGGLELYDSSIYHVASDLFKEKRYTLLCIYDREIKYVNSLLQKFLTNVKPSFFIKLMNIYQEAFYEKTNYIKYMLFMMILESLIIDDTNTGISYKIARMCAVLVGENSELAGHVLSKTKECYNIRSKLIHQAKNEISNGNCLLFIHSVICEILILFIILEPNEKTNIFQLTTPLGFGQRATLIKNTKLKRHQFY